MDTVATIETKLRALQPLHLRVDNESQRHNVPRGSQTHMKVTIVSAQFDGQALLARHRMVNEMLQEELRGGVHALALHTFTPQEWNARGETAADSPPCLGGESRAQKK